MLIKEVLCNGEEKLMKNKFLITVFLFAMICLLCTGCGSITPDFSGMKDKVEIQCGEKLDLENYLNDNLVIKASMEDETKEFKLSDLDHSISMDEKIYNAETGEVDTSDFGSFECEVDVDDRETKIKGSFVFTLDLKPLKIEKGFYVYEDEVSSTGYSLLGYCSFENTSKQLLHIKEIKVEYLDKDGISVCNTDLPEFAPEYLAKGRIGFLHDTFAGTNAVINAPEDIAEIKIDIDYERGSEDNSTLEVSKINLLNNYDYNFSGFAAEAIITNPYNKSVEYYNVVAGMYDKNDKLIGTMTAMDTSNLSAKSKAKKIVAWLPDSNTRPDLTKTVKASACVTAFEKK